MSLVNHVVVAHSCIGTVTRRDFVRDLSSYGISDPLAVYGWFEFDRSFSTPLLRLFNRVLQLAPAITQQGQWYRLLTPVVLHGSLAHLLINSMSFNSVGPVVGSTRGHD